MSPVQNVKDVPVLSSSLEDSMHPVHVNHAALVVSALILWFLGAFWYSPVAFAKPWIAIIGRKAGEKPKGLAAGMVGSFIGDLILSLVLAHVVAWSGAQGFAMGALVGFVMWLGFVVGPLYPQSVYEGRPFTYFAINSGYWLVGLLVAGGLLASWH
ncbi:DUF1761 domain-containing protein [Acidobacteria bacterium AB60]|nr:DUF1761 domain-containing protein [Acidobacteria bacterium AB60]